MSIRFWRFTGVCLPLLFAWVSGTGCAERIAPVSAHSGSDVVSTIADDAALNRRDAAGWAGTYSGLLPCADCAGIRITIRLRADGAFSREQLYLGKSDTGAHDTGQVSWNAAGSVVRLSSASGAAQRYLLGERRLVFLDRDGQRITGALADRYVLHKHVRDPRIEDRQWVLVEVMGERVEPREGMHRGAIVLDSSEDRISGNSACNRFFGGYALQAGQRLRVRGPLGSTRMVCAERQIEEGFLAAMDRVKGYTVDDQRLVLHGTDGAPVLSFVRAF